METLAPSAWQASITFLKLGIAETKKKIYVIGGGPAGMCAAFTAARRGHDVTLFEARDVLGGNMRLAAYPPGKGDITNMIRSYIKNVKNLV